MTFSVSAAKPITSGGRLPGRSAAMVLRMSGFSTSSSLGEALAPFLIFSLASRRHAPVGDGGGEDGDVGRQRRAHGLQHLARGLDAHHLHAGRIGQVGRAADERHLGAERCGLGGDRRALLAGGAVGDVAHRIDGLVRRAAGDEHMAAGEGPLARVPLPLVGRVRGGGIPTVGIPPPLPLPHKGEGETPAGSRSPPAARAPRRGGRGRPRRARPSRRRWARRNARRRPRSRATLRRVAGWSHMRGFMAGATSTGLSVAISTAAGEVVGVAARHLGQQVGGGRRHHDQVGLAREADVADLALVVEVEQLGEDALVGQRAHRQRRDELLRRPGHDRAHADARLAQAADQLQALVGGDAAADDQHDAGTEARSGTCFT